MNISDQLRNLIGGVCNAEFTDKQAEARDMYTEYEEREKLDEEFGKVIESRSLTLEELYYLTSQPFDDIDRTYEYLASVREYIFGRSDVVPGDYKAS